MKLTAKQLKALPDNEFGLVKNGKRSYPLVDKAHVRSAIAYFRYAAPEDRAELAKNINRKAREFNMKINANGSFVKYIDPRVISYDSSSTYVTDASNIGTLAPIVGAINSSNDNTLSDEAKQLIEVINDPGLFPKNNEPVKEDYKLQVYTKHYKTMDDFCKQFKTFDDVVMWFQTNHIKWPEMNNTDNPEPLNYTGTVHWPEDLLRDKIGNCFDQALFVYYFCKKNHIPARIYRVARFYDKKGGKESVLQCSSHFLTFVQRKMGVFVFSYNGVLTDTAGPFATYEKAAEKVEKHARWQFYAANSINEQIPKFRRIGQGKSKDGIIVKSGYFTKEDMDFFDKTYGNDRITQNEYVKKSKGCYFKEDGKVIHYSISALALASLSEFIGTAGSKLSYAIYLKEPEPVQERYSIRPTNIYGIYPHTKPVQDDRYSSAFGIFDEIIRAHVIDYELDEIRKYMTVNCDGSYNSHKCLCDCYTTKRLHEILDNYKKSNPEIITAQIASLLLSNMNKDRFLACLSIVYFRAPALITDIIIKVKEYHGFFGEIFSNTIYNRDFIPAMEKKTGGLNDDEIAFFEYLCNNAIRNLIDVVYLLDISICNKFNVVRAREKLHTDRNLFTVQGFFNDMMIDGFYCFRYKVDDFIEKEIMFVKKSGQYYLAKSCNIIDERRYVHYSIAILLIGNENNIDEVPVNIYEQYTRLKKQDYSCIDSIQSPSGIYSPDYYTLTSNPHTTAITENVVRRAKDFMSGIHVTDDGKVRIDLTNKLSFEHYEEIHKMIKTSYNTENYDETKRLLAYIFSMILTIEREYMNEEKGVNKKYINKDDPTYKEMVRLRSLYISDFKLYMRKIVGNEPGFKFLEYYSNSNENQYVYTVDASKLALAFRMIMI